MPTTADILVESADRPEGGGGLSACPVTASAAGIAVPGRPIFAVVGDGRFAMRSGEFFDSGPLPHSCRERGSRCHSRGVKGGEINRGRSAVEDQLGHRLAGRRRI